MCVKLLRYPTIASPKSTQSGNLHGFWFVTARCDQYYADPQQTAACMTSPPNPLSFELLLRCQSCDYSIISLYTYSSNLPRSYHYMSGQTSLEISTRMPLATLTRPIESHAPGSTTITQTATSSNPRLNLSTQTGTLRLRGEPIQRRRIRWAEDVVDNEHLGRKSSKGKF